MKNSPPFFEVIKRRTSNFVRLKGVFLLVPYAACLAPVGRRFETVVQEGVQAVHRKDISLSHIPFAEKCFLHCFLLLLYILQEAAISERQAP